MPSITKIINQKRRQQAIGTLRELANRLETGQLQVVDQGLWNGATQDVWIFRIEMKENPVPALSEELSKS